jgi:hypothetical protein
MMAHSRIGMTGAGLMLVLGVQKPGGGRLGRGRP